jgi:uncharacterized protein (DUF2345 family)
MDAFFDHIPYIMEGQVVSTDDPDQMGRCRVWVPALDGDTYQISQIPWADYAAPFFGFTVNFPAGGGPTSNNSHTAYGLWAIPKVGATVLVFFLNGDPAVRFYFAATARLHRNRSLPAGRNTDYNGNKGPFGDAGDGNGNLNKVQPAYSNLREQFQDQTDSPQAQSRGAFERAVAQAGTNKNGEDGYAPSPIPGESYLDPQTYAWVTPGHHAIIMQDYPKQGRLRIKTAEGHQVIFDDANERIYVSTAKGKTWLELDQDGHVHVFGADSISVRSGEDINLYADRDVNVEAGRSIHLKALTDDVRIDSGAKLHLRSVSSTFITACGNIEASTEAGLKLTSAGNLDIFSGGNIAQTASAGYDVLAGGNARHKAKRIDLNGPRPTEAEKAGCAEPAREPPVVPGHEPWSRPATKGTRGQNWKE